MDASPPESDHYKQALANLSKLSANIMQQYSKWRAANPQATAVQRPQIQGQPPGQTQHPPQQPPQAQPTQSAAPATQQQSALPPAILEHLKQFQFVNPKDKPRGTPEGEKWLTQAKNYYGNLLLKMERSKASLAQLDKVMDQRKAQNAQIPPDFEQRRNQAIKDYEQLKQDATTFRNSQAKALQQQPGASQNNTQVKVDGSGTQSSTGQQSFNIQMPGQQNPQQSAQRPPSTGSNATIDAVARSAPNQTRPTMSSSTSQQSQQMTQPAPSSYPQPQPSAQTMSQQQTPQSATATRPPLNTQIPAQVGQTPQSAVSGQPTGPRTLSHQEAISQAQRSYSDQRSTPQSTVGQYPQVGSREPPPSGNKYHIPKQLPERATTMPTAVPMGASRPTLSGPANGVGGMMGQPPIEKQTGMVFVEGEGSGGILSKNKLQELVREVGGPDESLTPPVEDVSFRNLEIFPILSLSVNDILPFLPGRKILHAANKTTFTLRRSSSLSQMNSSTTSSSPPPVLPNFVASKTSRSEISKWCSSATTIFVSQDTR
jgi:transcription initiation factor TFIID subunit 12